MHPVDQDFDLWFRATLPRVRRAARRIVGDGAEADDIAAEAFARALVRWSTVRDLPHRDAWVSRVATNLALDVVRSRSRRERILLLQRAAETVGDGTDASAERMALALALGRLPRRQREVIALRYLVGLPEAEVAAVLGVSSNTVKTHLSRALSALRDRLGSSWGEEAAGAH
ncbi:MAG TPA: sigma-70 family RNA polymerase sigma factor [Iamia sp.]|nr:sigma-70 family RNA polymerase sigma factor [Iamia sp.]